MPDKLTYPCPSEVHHGTVAKDLKELRKAIEHRIKKNNLGSVAIHSLLQTSVFEEIKISHLKTGDFHKDKKKILNAHDLAILHNLYGPITKRLHQILSGALTIGDDENKCDWMLDEISDLIRELRPKE